MLAVEYFHIWFDVFEKALIAWVLILHIPGRICVQRILFVIVFVESAATFRISINRVPVDRGLLKVKSVRLLKEFDALLLDSMDVDAQELGLTLLNLFEAL